MIACRRLHRIQTLIYYPENYDIVRTYTRIGSADTMIQYGHTPGHSTETRMQHGLSSKYGGDIKIYYQYYDIVKIHTRIMQTFEYSTDTRVQYSNIIIEYRYKNNIQSFFIVYSIDIRIQYTLQDILHHIILDENNKDIISTLEYYIYLFSKKKNSTNSMYTVQVLEHDTDTFTRLQSNHLDVIQTNI